MKEQTQLTLASEVKGLYDHTVGVVMTWTIKPSTTNLLLWYQMTS